MRYRRRRSSFRGRGRYRSGRRGVPRRRSVRRLRIGYRM